MIPTFAETAKIFKAFGDESRLMILDILKQGERCACNLLEELEISQSTLSHHMKILCDAGIVSARKEGKWTHYAINPCGSTAALAHLTQITSNDLPKGGNCCGMD